MEHYAARRKDETVQVATIWMGLKGTKPVGQGQMPDELTHSGVAERETNAGNGMERGQVLALGDRTEISEHWGNDGWWWGGGLAVSHQKHRWRDNLGHVA